MYYKKILGVPPLPESIKIKLNDHANKSMKNHSQVSWFQNYEYENKNSISYLTRGEEIKDATGKKSGGVGFYLIPSELNNFLKNYYKEYKTKEFGCNMFLIQVVTGGTFVSPHIDSSTHRKIGFVYLLKSGGSNVITTWYEPKEEYKDLGLTENSEIAYHKINAIEEHCLEENAWHRLNFNKIHGVKNQESTRVLLWNYN